MSVMAAAEAEVEFFGNCAGGDSDDRDQIEEMAASSDSYFSSEEWERWEPRMRRHTRSLVKRHRAKIERVARALIKHETLSAQRIDTASRKSSTPFWRLIGAKKGFRVEGRSGQQLSGWRSSGTQKKWR
jgi:hypothetical protein